jgi:DoxX-like family
MSKGERRVYWTATGIVCSVMMFSAINFNLANPFGPFERPFAHLGLPDYLRIELTVAKVLGVLALLISSVPPKIKEFAYFGFAMTLISASIAHFSSGDGLPKAGGAGTTERGGREAPVLGVAGSAPATALSVHAGRVRRGPAGARRDAGRRRGPNH